MSPLWVYNDSVYVCLYAVGVRFLYFAGASVMQVLIRSFISVSVLQHSFNDTVVIAMLVLAQRFLSFAVTDVHISVIHICAAQTCSGKTCRGLYGVAGCPCVSTPHGPCSIIISISASFGCRTPDGNFVDQFQELGLRLEPYISTQFTQQVVKQQLLEVSLCIA